MSTANDDNEAMDENCNRFIYIYIKKINTFSYLLIDTIFLTRQKINILSMNFENPEGILYT